MSVGRKPTPTKLRIIRGNPGKRSLPKDEPKIKASTPSAPASLSDEARKHWRKVVKQLGAAQIMTTLDTDALALYCEAYARWVNANDMIRQYGTVVKSLNGMPMQSPYLQIANKSHEQMVKLLVEFGMTPSSRTRVTTAKDAPEKDTGLSRFQNR